MTQADIARASGVGRWKIVDLEAGRLSLLSIDELGRSFGVLDARVNLSVWRNGAALDRLLDERHAALVGAVVELLKRRGWDVRVEVTFNEFGDRGSIDVLAWHSGRRALLVVEVKSELGSVEGTLRPFDIKARLARRIARDQFGWVAAIIGRVLVLPEERSARRQVQRHASVLSAALPRGSRDVRAWLYDPTQPIGAIWFLSFVGSADVKRNPSAIRRVRSQDPRSEQVPHSCRGARNSA